MSRVALAFAALCVVALAVTPAYPWLPMYNGNVNNVDRWDSTSFPVVWNLNPATGANVQGNRSVQDVIAVSFATWKNAPNTALPINQGPNSNVTSSDSSPSNVNLICFVCTDNDFTGDSNTLAITVTTTSNSAGQNDGHGGTTRFAGQIIKSDILFNPNVTYNSGGAQGEDMQVIATHEIGHFFGLDHSGVVRAVMFPYASDMTTLSYDDVAGISTVYPSTSQQFAPGTISGRVAFNTGSGVFGAHVFAESATGNLPMGGNIRKSPIGAVTAPDGIYSIRGIPADSYNVTAEPLDEPVSKSDIDTYPNAFGQASLQTNFTTKRR